MFNPCYEHCYLRFGNQYTEDCDDKCEFAKAVKEKKLLEEKNKDRENILEEIKTFLIDANKNSVRKHGVVYILKIEELEQLVGLIKKLAQ